MRKIVSLCVALVTFLACSFPASSQRLAVKTNALEWATLSPNLGIEARLSRRLTLDVSLMGNPFPVSISGVRLNNLLFQPGLRYWFNRPMARHFVALDFMGGIYNVRLRSRRYEGDVLGAGISYGYGLVLSRHWNVEFEAGVGLGRFHGYSYRDWIGKPANVNCNKWHIMPIRLGVTFSYVIK